jgi:hypothetical protein
MPEPTYDYPIALEDGQKYQPIVCNLCSAFIESEETHTAWHDDLDKRIRLAGVGTTPVPFFRGVVRE